jgi:hypothetical protein
MLVTVRGMIGKLTGVSLMSYHVYMCVRVCCGHNSADKLYDSTREFLPKVSIRAAAIYC